MSTAFYPLGMNSKPSSGYTQQGTYYNKQYIPCKGTGINSFPVGTAPGHIRPLTNKDTGNSFPTGFGLPRPIKHFRKGRVISNNETNIINYNNYNVNRFVKSSKGTSLGGGLINDMLDKPGSYIVKLNETLDDTRQLCEGVGIIASYKPNNHNLLDNPEPNTTNRGWCCNQEQKAKQRVMYASTNIKKNYYTNTKQYLQNRCKTFDQKAFNFVSTVAPNNGKPGSPLALTNTYLANCQISNQLYDGSVTDLINKMLEVILNERILSLEEVDTFNNTNINYITIKDFFNWIQSLPDEQKRQSVLVVFETFMNNPYIGMPLSGPTNPAGCQITVYKPNNYQYAKQGAVSCSTRMLNLNVRTITSNAASLVTANQLHVGDNNHNTSLLKNKAPNCDNSRPLNFSQVGPLKNKKFCSYKKNAW
jgi:hypothetical protein